VEGKAASPSYTAVSHYHSNPQASVEGEASDRTQLLYSDDPANGNWTAASGPDGTVAGEMINWAAVDCDIGPGNPASGASGPAT
jgi:hypothetical protein